MKTVRAKFYVQSVTVYSGGFNEVSLRPVTASSEENKKFWQATPSGELKMSISVPETAKLFQPGVEILIDFNIPETVGND